MGNHGAPRVPFSKAEAAEGSGPSGAGTELVAVLHRRGIKTPADRFQYVFTQARFYLSVDSFLEVF